MNIGAIFLSLLSLLTEHGSQISAEAIKTYADVAHGEGGVEKVAKAASDLAAIAATVAGAEKPAA